MDWLLFWIHVQLFSARYIWPLSDNLLILGKCQPVYKHCTLQTSLRETPSKTKSNKHKVPFLNNLPVRFELGVGEGPALSLPSLRHKYFIFRGVLARHQASGVPENELFFPRDWKQCNWYDRCPKHGLNSTHLNVKDGYATTAARIPHHSISYR